MSDIIIAQIWTPYVRKDCGYTPPHPVFLTIERDKPGVYCRLVTFNPYYLIANLYVQDSFLESAKKYINVPFINGRWQLSTLPQKARAKDVQFLKPYASFINSFIEKERFWEIRVSGWSNIQTVSGIGMTAEEAIEATGAKEEDCWQPMEVTREQFAATVRYNSQKNR